MENSGETLIDQEQVDTLKQLFNDGFGDFVTTFFKDFEKKEKELAIALETKSLDVAAKVAHTIKGSSANMGALKLSKTCSRIETAMKQGDITVGLKEYNDLKIIYPQTKEAFQRLIS